MITVIGKTEAHRRLLLHPFQAEGAIARDQ
jgi:hypothetical protein